MMNSDRPESEEPVVQGPLREVPVDWESLEDAFENNAPEVHSYLHLSTGEVIRVVDGLADPQMHARISGDTTYLRIDPVSSREQYRWMERFIPMVDELDLRSKLAHAIDGKGAFRRFKDVLMTNTAERERWFTFRSERLRTFMQAWIDANCIKPIPRPGWVEGAPSSGDASAESIAIPLTGGPVSVAAISSAPADEAPRSIGVRRQRSSETLRAALKDLADALGQRELDHLVSYAEFLKARRAARGFVHHHEHVLAERDERSVLSQRGGVIPPVPPTTESLDKPITPG